jgi:glycosyltransferase involved in cell wall biosynthesis
VIGGVEVVIGQQVKLFHIAGYSTLIISGRRGDLKPFNQIKDVIIPELDSEHLEVLSMQKVVMEGLVPDAFYSLRDKIKKALIQVLTPNDIVIAHNIMTTHFNLSLTSAIHDLTNDKVIRSLIIWCHDISRYINPESGSAQLKGFPWDLLRTFRPDSTYVAVSTQRKRALAKILGQPLDQFRLVLNGIDPAELLDLSEFGNQLVNEFGLLSADLIIFMPIRITRAKNIEFAMQICNVLKNTGLRIKLIISGPPDPHVPEIEKYFSELKDLRLTLNLTDEVVFINEGISSYPSPLYIDQKIISELYRICDLVLMPSIREGFGLPVLEAGLVDKPIFATNMPIIEDLGLGLAFIIKDGESPMEVAERINNWVIQDVSHNLRVDVRKNFTWSSIFINKIEPLVMQLASSQDGNQHEG